MQTVLQCPSFASRDEDQIVPPNQTEKMVDVIRAKAGRLPAVRRPTAWRSRAENIERTLDAELRFYTPLVLPTGLRC